MACGGDRHRDSGEDLEHLGLRDDLGLDPRCGKDQVDDHPDAVGTGADQPHGRESAHGVLLDEGLEAVSVRSQRPDQLLGGRITVDEYGYVDVAGESRLSPSRDRETPNQRPFGLSGIQIGRDPA
ncbi:MAG: hypothetical protein WCF33_24945 [Pseudonocardiaceae bacterium]